MRNDKETGENIIAAKEQREAFLDRVEVLNKVKALMLIPDLLMVTTQQAAEFFKVEVEAVQKCYQRNKDELDGNGVVFYTPSQVDVLIGQDVQLANMKGKRLYCVGKDAYFEIANRGTKLFPQRAILNLAMLLTGSRVAREVRAQLLNIAESTTPAARVAEIDNQLELQAEIGRAFASGDLQQFAEAAQKYNAYLGRHLAAAQVQVQELTVKSSALEEEKSALEDANIILDAANAMLAERELVWQPRATLNALIRAIAVAAFDHKYSRAWDRFYRELKYQEGMRIATRAEAKNGGLVLDSVRDEEWPKLLKVAASLCYDYCVDVVYATNKETVAEYHLDTIETEYGVRHNRGTVTRKMTDAASA